MPPKNTSGQERRRAERAAASFPISFGPAGKRSRATLRDLSTLGLCCESPIAVPEMTKLAIELEVPGHETTFETEGVVVRCEVLGEKPGKHELAVFFSELDPAHRRWIADYVARSKAGAGSRS